VHAALVRCDECAPNDVGGVVVQPKVVQGELEGLAGGLYEPFDQACDVERRLSAVGKRVNLDQVCCFARSDALYARFFAW